MGNVFVAEQNPNKIHVERVHIPPESTPSFSWVSQRNFTPELIARSRATIPPTTASAQTRLEIDIEKTKTTKAGIASTHISWMFKDEDDAKVCIELLHAIYNPLKLPIVAVNGKPVAVEWFHATRSTALVINKRLVQIAVMGAPLHFRSEAIDLLSLQYTLIIDSHRVADPNELVADTVIAQAMPTPPSSSASESFSSSAVAAGITSVPRKLDTGARSFSARMSLFGSSSNHHSTTNSNARFESQISPRLIRESSAPLLSEESTSPIYSFSATRPRTSSISPRTSHRTEYIF